MFSFKKLTIGLVLGLLIIPSFSFAWSQTATLNVDPNYDLSGRNQIETQLLKTTNKIYFYADKDWYQTFSQKSELDSKLYNLASDFEYKIYPTLTNLLGSEDNPGVDNDSRIIIVLEPLKDNYGGYIQSGDEYSRTQYKNSNEGQIIYLNANVITKADLNFLDYELAHEFTHLIEIKQRPEIDTWFAELLAEWAPNYLNYDLQGNILKKRTQAMVYSAELNLLDWKNNELDYGKVKLLSLYLTEQFGNNFLPEVFKHPAKDVFIAFNEILKGYNSALTFNNVYLNWLITNIINDCQIKQEYCYQNQFLKDFHIIAYNYYLPMQYHSLMSITDSLKTGTSKVQKLNGGKGILDLQFTIPLETPIQKIPYIIEDNTGRKTIGFLDFSSVNIQDIFVEKMSEQNIAVYFIPFIGFNNPSEKIYYYSWKATNVDSNSQTEQKLIEKLQQQIEGLKRQLAQLQMQIAFQKTNQTNQSCSLVFSQDLYYGLSSPEVKCLQQFLTNLGSSIYPEKLITGYYGPLTQAAVQRYQALKGIITTGYFGPLTRAAVNHNF